METTYGNVKQEIGKTQSKLMRAIDEEFEKKKEEIINAHRQEVEREKAKLRLSEEQVLQNYRY